VRSRRAAESTSPCTTAFARSSYNRDCTAHAMTCPVRHGASPCADRGKTSWPTWGLTSIHLPACRVAFHLPECRNDVCQKWSEEQAIGDRTLEGRGRRHEFHLHELGADCRGSLAQVWVGKRGAACDHRVHAGESTTRKDSRAIRTSCGERNTKIVAYSSLCTSGLNVTIRRRACEGEGLLELVQNCAIQSPRSEAVTAGNDHRQRSGTAANMP
jgi:hypothetical protein